MSIIVRPAAARGHADHGWLDSRHTFSFADYHDPAHMGFGPLRVINEDRVQPGAGFGTHGHRDMEIISYVLEGGLAHRDSMGNSSTLGAGEVQVMSAGAGVRHSEFNASSTERVHFLQIWILPDRRGLTPRYDQKTFPEAEKRGALRLVVSGDGRDGSLRIHRDADVYAAVLDRDAALSFAPRAARGVWIQVTRGAFAVNGVEVAAGDGLAITQESALTLVARADASELLLFDLS